MSDSSFLSDIELYFSTSFSLDNKSIVILGDEVRHVAKVMRHQSGDEIYITDGKGIIYQSRIVEITNEYVASTIIKTIKYKNEFSNICVCIPLIKNFDRLEFAIEKSIELGITDLLIYKAERSSPKKARMDRWQKIANAAMKQSLRSFIPKLNYVENLSELENADFVIFDQKVSDSLSDWKIDNKKYHFVFGPEGGFSDNEMQLFKNSTKLKLAGNRLRTETAVVAFASQLVMLQSK